MSRAQATAWMPEVGQCRSNCRTRKSDPYLRPSMVSYLVHPWSRAFDDTCAPTPVCAALAPTESENTSIEGSGSTEMAGGVTGCDTPSCLCHQNTDEMKPMDVPARRGADPQSHGQYGKGMQRSRAGKDAVSCHCFGETDCQVHQVATPRVSGVGSHRPPGSVRPVHCTPVLLHPHFLVTKEDPEQSVVAVVFSGVGRNELADAQLTQYFVRVGVFVQLE